ncbi:MAG: carboxypeptidase regulatory-like domain-containing protein [Opitutales bacterium]|nr:carboxypeptidase regulatory-like domain-containing protein [Opitutales bacterium]
MIEARQGTGGGRTVNANLVNRGTVRADGIVFDVGNNGRSVVLEEDGAFEGTGGGELVLDNAAVRLVGGEMRDGSRLNGGSLRVESTLLSQEVQVLRGFDLLQLDSPSVTVWAGGQPGSGAQFVTVPDGFVNRGILRLERADATSNIIVSVEDNGTFTNEGMIEALPGSGGNRTIHGSLVNEGTIRSADGVTLSFSRSGTTYINEGVLFADDGSLSFSGDAITNAPGGMIRGIGSVNLGGMTLQQDGTLAPGLPGVLGQLTIDGPTVFGPTGRVVVRLGGDDTAPESDRIHFSSTVTFSGELAIDNAGLFPEIGTSVDILTYDSHIDEFGLLTGTVLPGGLAFSLDFQADRLTITAEEGDDEGPVIVDEAFAGDTVRVRFFDAFGVDPDSADDSANYALARDGAPADGFLTSLTYDAVTRWIEGTLAPDLPPGVYTLTISGVENLAGTPMAEPHVVTFQPEDLLESIRTWHGDASGDWHDPANWFGRRVPGPTDEAVIPAGAGAVAISHGTEVMRVLASSPLHLEAGILTVNDGTSSLSAGLTLERRAGLRSVGADTVFTAHGPTHFEGGGLWALDGAILSLPDLEILSSASPSGTSQNHIEATGPGSLIDLPGVTAFEGGIPNFRFTAEDGGEVRLDALETITGRVTASATGGDSLLAFPSLVLWDGMNRDSALEPTDGGTIEVGTEVAATMFKRVFVELVGGGQMLTTDLTIDAAGQLQGTGSLTGHICPARLDMRRASSSAPPDVLTITGNLTLPADAETTFRAYSTGLPRVEISGIARLRGAFSLVTVNLNPAVGDAHTLFEATVLADGFTAWSGLDVAAGVTYEPAQTATALTLNGVGPVPPEVTAVTPEGPVNRFSQFVITFSKEMANSSVTRSAFELETPGGTLTAATVVRIAADTYRVTFAEQETPGLHTLRIGPALTDLAGNAMASVAIHEIEIAKPLLPDLAVSALTVSETVQAGTPVTVSWTVTNEGTAPLAGDWLETLYIESSPSGADAVFLKAYSAAAQAIAPGDSVLRTVTVDLPRAVPHGSVRFRVEADEDRTLDEWFTQNNRALSPPVPLSPALFFEPATAAVDENAGESALRPRLLRTGPLTNPLTVSLAASDPSSATAPESVEFPAGQRSIRIPITPVPDGVPAGDRATQITASADGFAPAVLDLVVRDTDRAALALSLDEPAVTEGESTVLRVTVPHPRATDLRVRLEASQPGRLHLPPSILIPAGETEGEAVVRAANTPVPTGNTVAVLRAEAASHLSASTELAVFDPKVPLLELSLREDTIRTGNNGESTVLTIRRTGINLLPQEIRLENPRPDLVPLAGAVFFEGGQEAVHLPVSARSGIVQGSAETVDFRARIGRPADPVSVSNTVTLTVVDDTTPHLSLRFDPPSALAGTSAAATLTVTRYPVDGTALTVALESNAPGKVAHAAGLTLPPGAASASVPVDTLPAPVPDQPATVVFNVYAAEHLPGAANLVVTSISRPDLALTAVEPPAAVFTESTMDVLLRVTNHGPGTAEGPVTLRVYVSDDPSRPTRFLVGQERIEISLTSGEILERTLAVPAPRIEGTFQVTGEVDPSAGMRDLRNDNNLRQGANPVEVAAAYTATVEAAITDAPAGTPIPLSGTAVKATDGSPAANVPVVVRITRGELERRIEFRTDANGQFNEVWQPLLRESGTFGIGAGHPGAAEFSVQDSVRLRGFDAQPRRLEARLTTGGEDAVLPFTLSNPGNVDLHGLHAGPLDGGGLAGLEVRFPHGTDLPAGGSLEAELVVSPLDIEGLGEVPVTLVAADGSEAVLTLDFRVLAERPKLEVDPRRLEGNVVRGRTKHTGLIVVNTGGAASGPLEILASPLPWLSLPVTALDPIAPDDYQEFTVTARPPADTPSGTVSGEILVREKEDGAFARIPFVLDVVSTETGGFAVDVENEFTYFAEGNPMVEGARVTLYDTRTGAPVASGLTGPDGRFETDGLPEGHYDVTIEATRHLPFENTAFIAAGNTAEVSAFLNYEPVRTFWEVVPVEFEDRYEIRIRTEFETNVPIPVVTIYPESVDLHSLLENRDSVQVDFIITNHGLVRADDVHFRLPQLPGIAVDAAAEEIGDLDALTSRTIPVRFTRAESPSGPFAVQSSAPPGADCVRRARVDYIYECGNLRIRRRTSSAISPESCRERTRPPQPESQVFRGHPGSGQRRAVHHTSGGGGWTETGGQRFRRIAGEAFRGTISDALDGVAQVREWVRGSGVGDCLGPLLDPIINCGKLGTKKMQAAAGALGTAKDLISRLDEAAELLERAFGERPPGSPPVSDEELLEFLASFDDNVQAIVGIALCVSEGDAFGCAKTALGALGDDLAGDILACLSSLNDLLGDVSPFGTMSPAGAPAPYAPGFATHGGGDPAGSSVVDGLRTYLERIQLYRDWLVFMTGSEAWVAGDNTGSIRTWMEVFDAAADSGDPLPRRISLAERTALLNLPRPSAVSAEETHRFIDRWNRTWDYADADIHEVEDVPPGDSTDFIPRAEFNALSAAVVQSFLDSQVDGFADPFAGFDFYFERFTREERRPVCATVTLEITQEAVLTRTGFDARLGLENDSGVDLENIFVDIAIRDATGERRGDLFAVVAGADNTWSDPDAANPLPDGGEDLRSWRIIPALDAAPGGEPVPYTIGGTLFYDQGGVPVTVSLDPVEIVVHPQPELQLDYYHERDVFANDPFTDVVEPSVPFSLGVLARNVGHGAARDLSIQTSQPEIVANEQGLAVDIRIVSVEVGGVTARESLTAEFGEIAPGTTGSAIWWLESTLQGRFIDYEASFVHLDAFESPRISLIRGVSIHETLGLVDEVRSGMPARRGFLVSDRFPVGPRPVEVHWTDGDVESVGWIGQGAFSTTPSPAQPTVTLSLGSVPPGWFYTRLPDPTNGEMPLQQVIRSDGRVLLPGANAWITDRTFRGPGLRPLKESILHLVDHGGGGTYTLVFGPDKFIDTTAPVSSVTALPAENYPGFLVQWSGLDANGVVGYDIYVSTDGGPFELWLGNTTATSAFFEGEPGRTYAFHSRARDAAGNVEDAPDTPDATTATSLVNAPPQIAAIADQTIPERQRFVLDVAASDPDQPAQTLTHTLEGDIPPAMTINPSTGRITWQTTETHGGTEWYITVRVTDDGWPSLSAEETFRLTVLEVNHPPTVLPISAQRVHQDETVAFVIAANDPDIPANQLIFSLDAGAPAGTAINPASGLFIWTPSRDVPVATYPVTVRVTDDGEPPLSGTRTFTVEVLPFRVDLSVTVDPAALTWTEGDPPIPLVPAADVTVGEPLQFAGGRLTAQIIAGGSAGDRLRLGTGPSGSGLYDIAGGIVRRNGADLGLIAVGLPATQTLRIDISAQSDHTIMQELMRLVTYENDERHPPERDRVIEFTLRDGANREATAVRAVSVIPVNTDPVITTTPAFSATRGRALDIVAADLLALAEDAEGDPLTLSLPGAASTGGAALDLGPERLRYAPPPAFAGWDTVPFRVSDPFGGESLGEARVWVRDYDSASAQALADPDGEAVDLVGIPGFQYALDWREPGSGEWVPFTTASLPETGALRFAAPPGVDPAAVEWRARRLGQPVIRIVETAPLRIQILGESGEPYEVLVSETLDAWQPFESGTLEPHDVLEWADPESGGAGDRRFYILGQ